MYLYLKVEKGNLFIVIYNIYIYELLMKHEVKMAAHWSVYDKTEKPISSYADQARIYRTSRTSFP